MTPYGTPPSLVGSLVALFPQRALALGGAGLLALAPAGLVWARLDGRTVDREATALKPVRFALSIGTYLLTASWMWGFVRPDRLTSAPVRAAFWMMVAGSAAEFVLILVQALRGRRSHFNTDTPFDAAIYAAMGLVAVLFVGAVLPLAWEVAWRPAIGADPAMVRAVVLGLAATFLVGGGTGGLMSGRLAHSVGPEGKRLPLFGWSLRGGDIRPPHFLGIHAMQALPLTAGVALWAQPRWGSLLSAIGAVGYLALTAGLLRRALLRQRRVTARDVESGRAAPAAEARHDRAGSPNHMQTR